MNADDSIVIFRKDYTPPSFWIDSVELEFDLDPHATVVRATLQLHRNADSTTRALLLDGEKLDLKSIAIDDVPLTGDQYLVDDHQLVIDELPDRCKLTTEVCIDPAANQALSGLYQSSGNFCTQCEAMGFRRITYFMDRPDVMTTYRVTLRADQDRYPVLLSNGNRIEATQLSDGRHQAIWQDPHPKPSYLFALVAGDLKCHSGSFVTKSGRQVELEIWVEPQNINRCEHALASLAKSMQWDEETFGLEYDLDTYMIVAVNDFNMGAMENKGLNIFNSKFVLASPETATDDDYERIEAVIAHEYFHNWTGNRVTCRDWFQLTLKEGLTVFRDQQFTADQTSDAVKRIDDVALLRSRQFAEDSGPMAHPIRPESYVSMDNFYTATVYNKGAEIIRMYYSRLGAAAFRRGMDIYFQRHDGSAATCDDFRAAMTDAGDQDFDLMERWYAQAGTPDLFVKASHDADKATYSLTMTQSYPELSGDIPGAKDRLPVPIPIGIGLIDEQGNDIPLRSNDVSVRADESSTSAMLVMEQETQTVTFTEVEKPVVPSVLRNFSAPVRLHLDHSNEELAFLMAHDSDPFNRWDASQRLATSLVLDSCAGSASPERLETYVDSFGAVLADQQLDEAFKATLLTLPSESVIGQAMSTVDPDGIHDAVQTVRRRIATAHQSELFRMYQSLHDGAPYSTSQVAVRRRRLKNVILRSLSMLDTNEVAECVVEQFDRADNMTDQQAALAILADSDIPHRAVALDAFHRQWDADPLVLDKWFMVQAASTRPDTTQQVRDLAGHSDFVLTNPNRVRSLIGVFAVNQARFHQADGAGYRLLADHVLKVDADNPQLAARLVSSFNSYRRFDASRQELVRNELSRISSHDGLSKDTNEIVDRALDF